MTTKQQKYENGLEGKGLKIFKAVIPIKEDERMRKLAAKLRKAHLKIKKGEAK